MTDQTLPNSPKSVSKTQWKQANVHKGVTLPSGVIVEISIPSLPRMIKAGQVPNHLIDVAIEQGSADKITKEVLEQTWDFTKFIVPQMIVSPKITEEDVEDLPALDLEMLISFASRTTDVDAVGHQLGGLETQDSFRNLRGFFSSDEALLDL